MFQVTDLDAFRSVEEYTTYQNTIRARMKELDTQYTGQPLPEEARSEFAVLTEINDEADARKREITARFELLRKIAADERKVEAPEVRRTEPTRAGSSIQNRRVPEDIFALEQYRSLSGSPEQEGQALIDGAKSAIDRAVYPHERADQNAIRDDLHRLFARVDDPVRLARHILATGSPHYSRAIVKYAARGAMTPDEERSIPYVRAQTLGTDSQGGAPVPFQLDPTIILTSDGVVNPLRQISRVERITGKKWQGVTSAGVTAAYGTGEQPVVGAQSLALAQPEVDTAVASAWFEYSVTLDLAWGALQAEFARLIQDARDTLEADKFVNGTGTNEPHGIVATLDPGSNVFVGGTFDIEDLFNIRSGTRGLPDRFEPRASWLGHRAVYDAVRLASLSVANSGAVFAESLQAGQPNRLIGYPAYNSSAMDKDVVSAGNDILVFGDFRYFLIVDRIGLTIRTVDVVMDQGTGRPKNTSGIYAYWMNQSLILTDNAFRKLRTGTGS